MTLLKIILIALGATFSIFGYLIYFKKKYNLINDYETNRKAGKKTESYARKVGLIELLLGIALIFSAVTVYMRDIQHFIGVVLQLLFYATPIVYSIDTIPENFRWILKWNPMTYIIEGYRAIFYNQTMPDLKSLGILGVISIVILIAGYLLFNKLQKRFAEEL